jgi:hypothetical protein
MENIFNDIQTALKTNVPEIKWIDIDENQLEVFAENIPVDFPCVLVAFPQANYSNIGRHQQVGEVTVMLKVAFRVYERFNAAVDSTFRTQAFAHFAVLRKVMQQIHCLSTAAGHYTPLIRKSWRKTNSIDPKVYEIEFQCNIKDESIAKAKAYTTIDNFNINNS